MITRVKITRFKSLRSAEIEFGGNVVFIGPNNSGKSTALQALTLWDAGWRRWAEKWEKKNPGGDYIKRPKVKSGVTINRRDLHAIPVPTAKLLWNDLHTHETDKSKKTTNVLMQVEVDGVSATGSWSCGMEFYYANEESFYCRLMGGADQHLPPEVYHHPVVFLPPMSGLADREFRKESGEIRMLTGQGQTAQVLRNLCWQLFSSNNKDAWNRLVAHIQEHFSVTMLPPAYDPVNSSLSLAYKDQKGTELDISSSGRGCQQVTLLLCFLLQHPGAILLLDEPDAHLEILRQRDIYTLLTEIAAQQNSQIIAASHSSTVMQVAGERDVLVAFLGSPHRVDTRARQNQVKKALESNLVTREALLAYVTTGLDSDDLFSIAESERRIRIMSGCIAELEQALAVTRKPSPWSADIKVTDDFLDPLFVNYYQKLGTPQLTYKRDYHGLAETIPLEQLDPEIDDLLSAVVSIASAAIPA